MRCGSWKKRQNEGEVLVTLGSLEEGWYQLLRRGSWRGAVFVGGDEESCSPHSRDIKRSVGCPVWIWESLAEGHRTTRCRKDQEFLGVKYEIVLEVKKAKLLGK